ncbi:MAG: hypothetical protein K0R54_73 [Clostridiaceae bacterium]|jgi:regulator of extracellular matrix RemA (YlzA/DUF370 family)|nr:hypothetical protein [Clostridiaceae bacterium]
MIEKVIGLGYENYIDKKRVIAVLNINSEKTIDLMKRAEKEGNLIDVTTGRKTKSLILTDTNLIFISAKNPNAILEKFSV